MLTLYVIADEQKLIEKLPVYVAANLLRIPFMNADSMDVLHMPQKFEFLEQRSLCLEKRCMQTCTVNNVQHVMESDPPADDHIVHTSVPVTPHADDVQSATDTDSPGASWSKQHKPVHSQLNSHCCDVSIQLLYRNTRHSLQTHDFTPS